MSEHGALTPEQISQMTSFTEADLQDPGMRAYLAAAGAKEIRVVLPMSAWNELEYLADDLPEQVAESLGEGVLVEGEEEGEWWAFYCTEMTLEQVLEQTRVAIPDGWTARQVPVSEGSYSASQIEIVRES